MAIQVNVRFQHLGASGGRTISAEQPVTNRDVEFLVENATHVYAFAGLRLAFLEAWSDPIDRRVANTSFVDIFDPCFEFSEDREDEPFRVAFTETAPNVLRVRVTIWNSTRTVVLSGPTVLSNPGGTLLAPGSRDVVIQVEIRRITGPDIGFLRSISGAESQLTEPNLP